MSDLIDRQADTLTSHQYWRACGMIDTIIIFALGLWCGAVFGFFIAGLMAAGRE